MYEFTNLLFSPCNIDIYLIEFQWNVATEFYGNTVFTTHVLKVKMPVWVTVYPCEMNAHKWEGRKAEGYNKKSAFLFAANARPLATPYVGIPIYLSVLSATGAKIGAVNKKTSSYSAQTTTSNIKQNMSSVCTTILFGKEGTVLLFF